MTSSAARPSQHDRRAKQGLHDHEDARHHRGDEHRQVAAALAEHGDEGHGADQRSDEDGGGQPMGVLDPGVEVSRGQPVAEAERPIRTAETRVGGAHEPAHGDQGEGRDRSGDRQLGESGQIGFLSPLIGGRASGRRHDSRRVPEAGSSADPSARR